LHIFLKHFGTFVRLFWRFSLQLNLYWGNLSCTFDSKSQNNWQLSSGLPTGLGQKRKKTQFESEKEIK